MTSFQRDLILWLVVIALWLLTAGTNIQMSDRITGLVTFSEGLRAEAAALKRELLRIEGETLFGEMEEKGE